MMETNSNPYLLRQLEKLIKTEYPVQRKHFGTDTNVFRLYDGNLKSFPFSIDIYNDYVLMTHYEIFEENFLEEIKHCISSSLHMPRKNLIVKSRVHKQIGNDNQSSNQENCKVVVKESGILFGTELVQKLDTGIFIENQRSRLLVRELSKNRNVLNLFCYTGGYTLFAFKGEARSCTSVDTSAWALNKCNENMILNGFDANNYNFVQEDAMKFIKSYSGDKFDLIIIDCPAFSNKHGKKTFNVQQDHVEMINSCKRIMSKDAILLFRTALSTFELKKDELKSFKILTYTSEMIPRGFTRFSNISKTFALRLFNFVHQKKY